MTRLWLQTVNGRSIISGSVRLRHGLFATVILTITLQGDTVLRANCPHRLGLSGFCSMA